MVIRHLYTLWSDHPFDTIHNDYNVTDYIPYAVLYIHVPQFFNFNKETPVEIHYIDFLTH